MCVHENSKRVYVSGPCVYCVSPCVRRAAAAAAVVGRRRWWSCACASVTRVSHDDDDDDEPDRTDHPNAILVLVRSDFHLKATPRFTCRSLIHIDRGAYAVSTAVHSTIEFSISVFGYDVTEKTRSADTPIMPIVDVYENV